MRNLKKLIQMNPTMKLNIDPGSYKNTERYVLRKPLARGLWAGNRPQPLLQQIDTHMFNHRSVIVA